MVSEAAVTADLTASLAVQAKAVKAKRIAITGEPSITGEKVKISKSQSALVNQYTTMEKKLKAQVTHHHPPPHTIHPSDDTLGYHPSCDAESRPV